jgi:hypothetical protein
MTSLQDRFIIFLPSTKEAARSCAAFEANLSSDASGFSGKGKHGFSS